MSEVGPASLPFHVARTYGVRGTGTAARPEGTGQTPQATQPRASGQVQKPQGPEKPLNDPSMFRAGSARGPEGGQRPLKVRAMNPMAAARVAQQVDLGAAASAEVDKASLSSGRTVRAEAGTTAQADHAMQLYRHPADKNAAATALQAGKLLDQQA